MKVSAAIAGGVAGTLAVASLHEAFRQITPDAPRMDILNKDLIRKGLKSIRRDVPDEKNLERLSVGGELLIDASYYSLAGLGNKKGVWVRGALMGLFAGITAAVLPEPFGLQKSSTNKTVGTQLMAVGLYVVGGLVAAAVANLVENVQTNEETEADIPARAEAYDTLPAGEYVF